MDGSQIEHEQQDVGGVDLPHAPQQPRRSEDEAAIDHSSAEDERRGVAGYEHEQIGAVAEAVVPERKPGQYAGQASTLVETWPRNISQLARPRNRSSRKSRFDGGSASSTRIRSQPTSDPHASAGVFRRASKPWKRSLGNAALEMQPWKRYGVGEAGLLSHVNSRDWPRLPEAVARPAKARLILRCGRPVS